MSVTAVATAEEEEVVVVVFGDLMKDLFNLTTLRTADDGLPDTSQLPLRRAPS